jgi:hypothetical protein
MCTLADADARAVPDVLTTDECRQHAPAVGPDKEEIAHGEREKKPDQESNIQDS